MNNNITDDIKYIGVNDNNIVLFEKQYPVKNGMSYNSYLILDEKIAVFDTVEKSFTDEWFANLSRELNGKTPDYLIVQHMEPDHSANINNFAEKYQDAKIVATTAAFAMMEQFFGKSFTERGIEVNDGDTLSLGKHTLNFYKAPMVHWPEVMVTYDSTSKILFSADAFGKFGTPDTDEPWIDEARRYYFGIVGKYGAQVQNLLKKASSLDIATICPLHGPVLKENISYYVDLYNNWSSYKADSEDILIAYTSVYGHTEKAVNILAEKLKSKGCNVVLNNLIECTVSEAVANAFKYNKIVLATTTYNTDIFPPMRNFIEHLTARNFQNRTIGLIENGSWVPMAANVMKKMFENSKNINIIEQSVSIKSALNDENLNQLDIMASQLV